MCRLQANANKDAGSTVVRKYEPPIRTIIVAVIHIPILRWVLLEISVVRRDLCHFRHSCHAQYQGSLFIRANP